MSESIENIELKKFHQSLIQDLQITQVSEEEGGTLEQIFTQVAVDFLADAGETENVRVAYDEGQLGTKNQHKINAYAEPDNYETVDLFITIFKGTSEPTRVAKEEVDTAAKRIANFYRKAKYRDYVNEIEESSHIWDFAHTLSTSELLRENLVRINALILTDGMYSGETPANLDISGCPVFFRVVDINYLYNISEKSHIPIEIDFQQEGFNVPCIVSPAENDQYQSYLAIIPGIALATIYERYGSRLLEQNVRSFLQFTGKINNGIRKTIKDEPQMFLAFNNGIAATAEHIETGPSEDGKGFVITKVRDFQIVNGGQTTASIYHTLKKDKADITEIFVQVKLSVVKNRENFSEIVARIAEYANTQNKVSVSDLSSNKPFHIELEKLSRSIFAPHTTGQTNQTKWFYERARGQYKNARLKDGFTQARQKAFDTKHPRNQVFTKEDLAKYQNTFQEIYYGRKLVIGPQIVVRGNQKNYVQFINYDPVAKSDVAKSDSIYFEDFVAKAILFRTAEKIYGVKPNSIGDMRYLTVPYSLALLAYRTENRIDFYKIWKNQGVSLELKELLYELMGKVEDRIKNTAAGALYGEWTKKEECWNDIKTFDFTIDFVGRLPKDIFDPVNQPQRRKLTDNETAKAQIQEELSRLNAVPPEIWSKVARWGSNTGRLTPQQITVAYNLDTRLRRKTNIDDYTRKTGLALIDMVIEEVPELFQDINHFTIVDLIRKIVRWNSTHHILDAEQHRFLVDIINGRRNLTEESKVTVLQYLGHVKQHGFGR